MSVKYVIGHWTGVNSYNITDKILKSYQIVIGKNGEDIASNYLKDLGYNILEKNFLCRSGEIDIIAKDDEELVFVEVKSRTNYLYGHGIDAIDKNKMKNIYRTAEYYLYINN